MRLDAFEFLGNLDTLWAIILGAILATIGGFVATQLEWLLEQRRRERNAALFFGEVLSTLAILLDIADESRGRGDPYGPVTLRMLKSARREIDIYDRNRESLYDLRDSDLRARLHTLILRISMPMEAVFDTTSEIEGLQIKLKSQATPEEERAELGARLEGLRENRAISFDFAMENCKRLRATVKDLAPLARYSFDAIDAVVRRG